MNKDGKKMDVLERAAKLTQWEVYLEDTIQSEIKSIHSFLRSHWDISIHRGALPQLVAYILGSGMIQGVLQTEDKNEKELACEQRGIRPDSVLLSLISPLLNCRETKPYFTSTEDSPFKTYLDNELSNLDFFVKYFWNLSARPKGYNAAVLAYEEFPEKFLVLPYNGIILHNSIGILSPSFGEALTAQKVAYFERKFDWSPEKSVIIAIFNQGMTLGITDAEKRYVDLLQNVHDEIDKNLREGTLANPYAAKTMKSFLRMKLDQRE